MPETVAEVVALAQKDDAAERREALARERKSVESKRRNLVDAIEAGDGKPLVPRFLEVEDRIRQIDAEMSSAHSSDSSTSTASRR